MFFWDTDPMPATPRLIVILGPTAGGKSELAVGLAEALGGEVIGADSMQVYRHMDAGTAKPAGRLRRRVPHHLIDIVEPTERFTVADWLSRAERLIGRCQAAGRYPIVVGGTNLYIKALLEGMFEGPAVDRELRRRLAQMPASELHQRLQGVDPISAARIHPNDRKKLIRALEVYELTGQPISRWQRQWADAPSWSAGSAGVAVRRAARTPVRYRFDPVLIGLDWPVESINQRINRRVKAMFYPGSRECGGDDGLRDPGQDREPVESLPEEVARLERAGLLGSQAREALGYKQVLEHLAGRCTLEEAFEKTKILTRRLAKTQRTWLKRFAGVRWLDAAGLSEHELTAAAIAHVRSELGAS